MQFGRLCLLLRISCAPRGPSAKFLVENGKVYYVWRFYWNDYKNISKLWRLSRDSPPFWMSFCLVCCSFIIKSAAASACIVWQLQLTVGDSRCSFSCLTMNNHMHFIIPFHCFSRSSTLLKDALGVFAFSCGSLWCVKTQFYSFIFLTSLCAVK